MLENEYLRAAADAVTEQAFGTPGIGVPVDPDVAEFMGAFSEDALTLDDLDGPELPEVRDER